MNTITIKYGLTKSITQEVEEGASFGSILTSAVLAVLGAPESVVPVIDGEYQDLEDSVPSNAVIHLERNASRKA